MLENIIKICIVAIIIFEVLVTAVTGRVNKEGAENALKGLGFTNISTGGYGWFSCGNDFYQTKFTAINPQGLAVSGTVCSGFFFKNSTVRFD